MGTRNLTAVVMNDKYVVAQYGQWDGYIEGQGYVVSDFLMAYDLDKFKEKLLKVEFTEDYGAAKFNRDDGSTILKKIAEGKSNILINELDFAADSLFCEYAYVLNMDTNELEVFTGFNKCELNKGERFYSMTEKVEAHSDYQPIKFLFKLPFSECTREKLIATYNELTSEDE